jgi:hypothetical protein
LLITKTVFLPGLVLHACNPKTRVAGTGWCEVKVSLGILRSSLVKEKNIIFFLSNPLIIQNISTSLTCSHCTSLLYFEILIFYSLTIIHLQSTNCYAWPIRSIHCPGCWGLGFLHESTHHIRHRPGIHYACNRETSQTFPHLKLVGFRVSWEVWGYPINKENDLRRQSS